MRIAISWIAWPLCNHETCGSSCLGSEEVVASGEVNLATGAVSNLDWSPEVIISDMDRALLCDALVDEAERQAESAARLGVAHG